MLITRQPFGLDDFVLESLDVVVVKVESYPERPIGYPTLALEEIDHLCQDLIERHAYPPVPFAQI